MIGGGEERGEWYISSTKEKQIGEKSSSLGVLVAVH